MARYFFHIYDGVSHPDDEGVELSGLPEAQEEAMRFAGATIADNAKAAKLGEDWLMKVADDTGSVVFSVHFQINAASPAPAARP